MTHDHLDDLLTGMRQFRILLGELPGLWKADVDAAFRRVPIKPEHRWASGVAFRLSEMVCSLDALRIIGNAFHNHIIRLSDMLYETLLGLY